MSALDEIPLVIDDDVPFVFHPEADPRPFIDRGGSRLRRGTDRFIVETPIRGSWINTIILNTERGAYLMASLGPLLTPYWQAFAKKGIDFLTVGERISAPTLFAAIASKKVIFVGDNGLTYPFSVVRCDNSVTCVVFAVTGQADTDLDEFMILSCFPAKKALDILNEISALRSTKSTRKEQFTWNQFFDEDFDEFAEKLASALDFINKKLSA